LPLFKLSFLGSLFIVLSVFFFSRSSCSTKLLLPVWSFPPQCSDQEGDPTFQSLPHPRFFEAHSKPGVFVKKEDVFSPSVLDTRSRFCPPPGQSHLRFFSLHCFSESERCPSQSQTGSRFLFSPSGHRRLGSQNRPSRHWIHSQFRDNGPVCLPPSFAVYRPRESALFCSPGSFFPFSPLAITNTVKGGRPPFGFPFYRLPSLSPPLILATPPSTRTPLPSNPLSHCTRA